jgi:hypothetical protein
VDLLMAFGAVAVASMLVFYALEESARCDSSSPSRGACLASSA